MWDLYIIEYACSHEPWGGLVNGMEQEGMVDLPFSFILACHGERKILIDSGFMQTGSRNEFPLKFSVTQWISPIRMLEQIGIAPEDIQDIVITHAHFDHMGAIGEFPNAQIHIQKRELMSWYEAAALPKRFSHLTKIIDPENLRQVLDASFDHRVSLIDGDKDNILPGVHVRLAPGHTLGHQFVIVESSAGRKVISGDCIYTHRQLSGHKHDGVYAPLNNATGSVWDQLISIDRLNDELLGDKTNLIIQHDVDRWKEYPVVAELEGYRVVKVV
ncbi:N-acyl homoserine lactonase family protein [Pokkaliibacter sp. CJK22405]|uniref:N-acyl homoserine lactonase family protein n=1 Tax=Pokkaliibacter sp. CJK22405 TaxID=3384615 RepID=UPI00398556A0